MQKLAEVCIRRPVFALMLILALVVVGAAGYVRLGVDRLPSVDLPTVRVSTALPGASPAEVEAQVSRPIEEVVNTVAGISELRSISGPGMSLVLVTFELDRDIDTATQDVRDRVATVLRRLPREALPPVISKFDNDQSPVLTLSLSGPRPLRELTELADKVVKVQIERASGVGGVQVEGGAERAMNLWLDASRLAAYGLPVTAVRDALNRQNVDIPGGNVTGAIRESSLRTPGRMTSAAEFDDLVIAYRNGDPIRLRDVGRAEDGAKEQRSVTRLNGEPAVILEVRRQSGANTVAVIDAVKSRLPALAAQLPPDVRFEVIRDQSRYIHQALHEINVHLVLGSVLACLVVLLFMRDWRSTLIASVAIPASVIATFGMMWALQFTLNSVTMLALVLMVGIVIDDAIVVLENIHRFVEEKGHSPFEAARLATAEIGLAVMATTLSLVVIFVPVSFMSSLSGRFLFQFGITAAVAVLVSLLVSFTLTPMMSARLLRRRPGATPTPESGRPRFYAAMERSYLALLDRCLRHRGWLLATAALVVASSVPLYALVRQEYVPTDIDEGEFEVSVTAPEGTSMASMNAALREIEDEVARTPGVATVLATAGGGFLGSVNTGRLFVRLVPFEERRFTGSRLLAETLRLRPQQSWQGNRTQREVMQDVRERLRRFGLRIGVNNVQSFNFGGSRWDIDFAFLGPDLEQLAAYADGLRARAPELGLQDADTTLRLDKPELQVVIDRDRAAALNVSTANIADALRLMVGGDDQVSRFRDPGMNEDYDVTLRLTEGDRLDGDVIAGLFVPDQNGQLVRLDNLVHLLPTQAASRIDRLDRQRQVSLRSSIAPGYALADRLVVLRRETEALRMPPGYTTRVAGRGRELERTFREFLWAFALSVVFMYMILAAQYESLVHPFTILLSLPLSVPFALFSLWATNHTLNLYSALGLLVLFGVVKKNAILQIDHANQLRRKGLDRHAALLEANRDRLRPILMTTLALVAGMLPLALGTGPGSDERRSIAIVVIGGQSLALLLTLLVTPVMYSVLDDLGQRFRRAPEAPPATTALPAGIPTH
ncbi:MAG: efflux RND transporter permease subunit [Verrucomicrobiae bacterium]|nr:efflux RND transporter permease subunit [Verrucomicrobiae bacterium]